MREFIHCDIKPENVRLNSACDSAVLVDWGFARHIYKQHAFVTEGTPVYASPEQLTGYSADMAWGRLRLGPSADVWALGTSLYEMLVGRPPFSASPSGRWAAAREANAEASVESFDALVANVLRLNYEMPDELSLEVRQLIDAMLQVQPSDRASIGELCLDRWVTALGPVPPDAPEGVTVQCGECEATPLLGFDRVRQLFVLKWKQLALSTLYALLLLAGLALHLRSGTGVLHGLQLNAITSGASAV